MKSKKPRFPNSAGQLLTTATVAALGISVQGSPGATVLYSLSSPVAYATDPALLGGAMFLRWLVDSAGISAGPYYKTAPVLAFEFGVEGTSEIWTGTGGEFQFKATSFGLELSPSYGAVYTANGSFPASNAFFDYTGYPMIEAFDYDGLPSRITFAFLFVVTSTSFHVSNYPNPARESLSMNKTNGVVLTATAIPEPGTAALLGLAALALLRRSRHGPPSA